MGTRPACPPDTTRVHGGVALWVHAGGECLSTPRIGAAALGASGRGLRPRRDGGSARSVISDRIVPGLRVSARAGGFALLTLVQLAAVEAHQRAVREPQRREVFQRHMKAWVRILLKLFGVRLTVQPGHAPPPTAKARLIVSNHRSPVDIAILLSIFGGQVLSRADLANWPILGVAARKAGTIFVDRDASGSGARAIRVIQRCLKDGATVIVFPEGTTFEGDEVRPFRAGAFVGVQYIDLDIVCVGLAYDPGAEFLDETFVAHLKRTAVRPRTRVAVRIGGPIRPGGKAAELADSLQREVQRLVSEARTDLASVR